MRLDPSDETCSESSGFTNTTYDSEVFDTSAAMVLHSPKIQKPKGTPRPETSGEEGFNRELLRTREFTRGETSRRETTGDETISDNTNSDERQARMQQTLIALQETMQTLARKVIDIQKTNATVISSRFDIERDIDHQVVDEEIIRMRSSLEGPPPEDGNRTTVHFQDQMDGDDIPRRSNISVPPTFSLDELPDVPTELEDNRVFNALRLVPKFEANSKDLVTFLETSKYVVKTFRTPEQRAQIVRGIKSTRITGTAQIEVKHRQIQTFDDLENVLNSLYKPARTTATVQMELLQCR